MTQAGGGSSGERSDCAAAGTAETWFKSAARRRRNGRFCRAVSGQETIGPFARFRMALRAGQLFEPTGKVVAGAVRAELWLELRVEEQSGEIGARRESVHATVWEQMNVLLDDLERGVRHGNAAVARSGWRLWKLV